MKTRIALCVFLITASVSLRAEDAAPRGLPAGEQSESLTPENVLARQVSEIAATSGMSQRTKAKRIAAAVRLAVVTTTTDIKDPTQALQSALELAKAATQAAPQFAKSIRDAIISIPSIASIEGALALLQAAIKEAAESAGDGRTVVHFAEPDAHVPQNPELPHGNPPGPIVSPSH